jgi:3-hydroxyisobutyrate dehydrogenase-like beta-hydroxyacid dehydrogenase
VKVAVVGAGRMGAAMSRRLAGAGHDVVVFNRTAEKAVRLADDIGAIVASTARDAAAQADVVVVSLADDAAVEAACNGDDGLFAGLGEGAVVCDTSTVDPDTPRRLAAIARTRGAALLDTPVSGSVPLVERGELTIMAGGDAAALERARPALESFASTILHLGGVGAGAVMKLVVNSVIHALNAALSEAIVLAERAGIDRAITYDVLEASAVAAPFVKYKRPAFIDPDQTAVAFSLALVAKDQELIAALADRVGARMEEAAAARALVASAVEAGLGEEDMAALAQYLRSD